MLGTVDQFVIHGDQIKQGLLIIMVSERVLDSDLRVYNYLGQEIYTTHITRTEEYVRLSSESQFYIVVLRSGKQYLAGKIAVNP